MGLFIARWPDGSAWLVDAGSMAEVADVLDEVGDPGSCEVQPYEGPLAIEFRPRKHRDAKDDALLDLRETQAADTGTDMQEALLQAAFPRVHAAVERARTEDEDDPDEEEWQAALAKEAVRPLEPSRTWAAAVRDWWKEFAGGAPDDPASTRPYGVTIPAIADPPRRRPPRRWPRR